MSPDSAHGMTGAAPTADSLLNTACTALPVLGRTIRDDGRRRLAAHLAQATAAAARADTRDLAAVAGELAAGFFGPDLGRHTADAIMERPAVLTANHHGVDCFAQSVQGNLLCALLAPDAHRPPVLPVLAFANVALNNLTYPRGLLIYDPAAVAKHGQPLRYPLFSARDRRLPVISTPAYTAGQVEALAARLEARPPHPALNAAAGRLLGGTYLSPPLLALPTYLHQATLINRDIWHRMTAGLDPAAVPELVCLAMEEVASRLLVADLSRTDSLAHRCLFEPALSRGAVGGPGRHAGMLGRPRARRPAAARSSSGAWTTGAAASPS